MSSASSTSSSSGCNFRVGDRVHLLVEVRECKTQANLLVVHVKRSRKKRFAWTLTLKLDKYDDETWEKDADECVLQKLNQEPEVVHWTKPDPAPLPKQKKME